MTQFDDPLAVLIGRVNCPGVVDGAVGHLYGVVRFLLVLIHLDEPIFCGEMTLNLLGLITIIALGINVGMMIV